MLFGIWRASIGNFIFGCKTSRSRDVMLSLPFPTTTPLTDTLDKAKARSKHWERKAKATIERITGVEKERDEAKEEAKHARLAAVAAGDVKARAEYNLVRVQDALVIAEEARHKAEAEVAHLEVERTSLLLEIGVTKDKVSFLHSQAGKDKVAKEEDYQKALELIFAYGYRCCMFKHNICGD